MTALSHDALGSYLLSVEEILHIHIYGKLFIAAALVVYVVSVSLPAYLFAVDLKGLVALDVYDVTEV